MKRGVIGLFFIIISSVGFGQELALEWAKTLSIYQFNHHYVKVNKIEINSKGESIVIGQFVGNLDLDPGPATYMTSSGTHFGTFMIKLDPDGNFIWGGVLPSLGKDLNNDYNAIIDYTINDKDEILVFGSHRGKADIDLSGSDEIHEGNGGYLLKISDDGNLIWSRHFKSDKQYAVSTNSRIESFKNKIFLFTTPNQTMDYNPGLGTQYLFETNGVAIIEYSQAGDFIESIQFGNEKTIVDDLDLDPNGNFYFYGRFNGRTDFTPDQTTHELKTNNDRDYDQFLLKLSSTGSFEWVNHFKPHIIQGNHVWQNFKCLVSNSNAVFIAFINYDRLDIDPSKDTLLTQPQTSHICRFNSKGTLEWHRQIGQTTGGKAFPSSITIEPNNELIIGGMLYRSAVDFNPSPNHKFELTPQNETRDNFILRMSETGDFIWASQFKSESRADFGYLTSNRKGSIFYTGGHGLNYDADPDTGKYIINENQHENLLFSKLNLPKQLDLGPDTTLCTDSIFITSNYRIDYYPHQWSTGSTDSGIWVTKSGEYVLEVELPFQTLRDTVNITIYPIPTVYIGPDTAFCGNFEYQLHANNPKGDSIAYYNWNTGDTTAYTIARKEGLYHVQVKSEYDCPNADTMQLTELPPPELALTEADCDKGKLTLQAYPEDQQQVQYLWNTGENTKDLVIYDTGYFRIEISRPFCIKSDSIYIPNLCPGVYIPNAFTPNHDALNEGFKPLGIRIKTYEITILNRWGEILFSGSPNTPWNGYYKNRPVTNGSYMYLVTLKLKDGDIQHQKGIVQVVN